MNGILQDWMGSVGSLQGAWRPSDTDFYARPRVLLTVKQGMRLTLRVKTIVRSRVRCTSDPLWRDAHGHGSRRSCVVRPLIPSIFSSVPFVACQRVCVQAWV